MSAAPEPRIETAGLAIARCRDLVDRIARSLRQRSLKGDRVSADRLDTHQWVAYELAQSAAEVAAAGHTLDHAAAARARLGGDGLRIEERFALTFAAECLTNLRARLDARPDDFGVPTDEAAVLDAPALVAFRRAALSPAFVEETGRQVRERGGDLGDALLDEDHALMAEMFRRFADDVVAPLAERIHRHDELIPAEILDGVRELGCFGLSIPERYGGLMDDEREDTMKMVIVTDELSRGSLAGAGSLITRPEILARALLAGGTEEQRASWLPRLAAGDPLCAVAVTEPDHGSDVAAMTFQATPTAGGWLLNGAKSWCTFGGRAGLLLVLARTEPDRSLGHKGLSLFLVEKPSFDGHEFVHRQEGGGQMTGRAIPTIGYRGMHSFDLFFEDYFVPDEALVGGPAGRGRGFYFTMSGFAGGRIQTAARALGVMRAAFERAVSYAADRKVFGQPIGTYPLTLVKLARMAMLIAVGRQFTHAVAKRLDQGAGQMEASLVKFFACKTAEWVTREAMQIHGGMGYAEETAVSRYFVDARVLSIFEGAEETLALKVIARTLVDEAR